MKNSILHVTLLLQFRYFSVAKINTNPMAPTPWVWCPHRLYNHFLWLIGNLTVHYIKICKLPKTIFTTLAPFQHGYRSSVLILHQSFSNVYKPFLFTSSTNSFLVYISNLPFGLCSGGFQILWPWAIFYMRGPACERREQPGVIRFENILYFLQTEDNICNQGIFELQFEDNIRGYFSSKIMLIYAFWR